MAAQPELADALLSLEGTLGAGKTTLARHLLRALGVSGRIKSPSYAVVESYQLTRPSGPPLNLWHFDFYRFADPREWEDAGFRELFTSPGLKLCEWAQKAAPMLPTPDLRIHLSAVDEEQRQVVLTALTPRGRRLLEGLDGGSAP